MLSDKTYLTWSIISVIDLPLRYYLSGECLVLETFFSGKRNAIIIKGKNISRSYAVLEFSRVTELRE